MMHPTPFHPGLMSLGILSPPPTPSFLKPSFFHDLAFPVSTPAIIIEILFASKVDYFSFWIGYLLQLLAFESILHFTSEVIPQLHHVTLLHK